jgi:hypothetical protein
MGSKSAFVTDKGLLRPGDPYSIAGSHERFSKATGWQPRFVSEGELLDAFLADL